MGEDWDSWAKITRSCILTSKTPLTPWEINRDTKMLEGRDIPFKLFNFRTLEEMLRSVPGLKVFQVQGKTVVQAIPTEESQHITQMIRFQKNSKKKSRTIPPAFNNFAMMNKRPLYRTPMVNKNVPQTKNSNVQSRLQVSNQSYSAKQPYNEPQKRPMTTPSSQQVFFSGNFETKPKPTPVQTSTPVQATKPKVTPTPVQMPKKPAPPQKKTPSPPPPRPVQQVPQTFVPPQPPAAPRNVQFSTIPVQDRLKINQGVAQPVPAPTPVSQRLATAVSPPPRPASPTFDDPRLKLNRYTEERNLPFPVYKDLPTKNKYIYSLVTVNQKKYSSYPKEAKTKDEAEKIAAQAALDDLVGKDKTPTIITEDKKLILARILEIVNRHPNGLFESSVVDNYVEKYCEGLPKSWLQIVERYLTIDVGANNWTILRPQKTDSTSKSSSPVPSLDPEVLRLNNMEEFWLHVYVVYSTNDIWGVIIDENHSDKIDELANEMKVYYGVSTSDSVTTATPGRFYAIFESEWHRVRCIRVDPVTQLATVFFIDRGDEDAYPVGQLRQLHPQFCRLPGQSVRLSMEGLEIFEDSDAAKTLVEKLLVDKDVYVHMRHDQQQGEDRYSKALSAQIYVERNNEGINVNDFLRNDILSKLGDPMTLIGTDKVAQEVHISYVGEKEIYVQIKSMGLMHLNLLMDDLAKDYLDNECFKLSPVTKFDESKMYVTKKADDNKWYRVKLLNIEDNNTAHAICIDVGKRLRVTKESLVLLEEISELLAMYPKQALKVWLHKISPLTYDAKMMAHLRKLAPNTDVFYMKVVGEHEDLPMVEFYKRMENNYLASLNDTIALEPEITSKDDNNNAKPRVRHDRSLINHRSNFPLKAPTIPSIGEDFDVFITMAAHPGNFTVQPLASTHELEKLMIELSRVCESYTGPALTPTCVKVGSMYAAKYDDDGRWYRAYVSKVISKNVCAVYFCDYGDYRAVSLEHLQPLQNQFYDLPYQAIKARLFGVTPKLKGDWTVKDSLRFNELIVTRRFVSIIKSCDVDNTASGDIILGLELIDTSTPEDVYITNVLINEKRADKLEEKV